MEKTRDLTTYRKGAKVIDFLRAARERFYLKKQERERTRFGQWKPSSCHASNINLECPREMYHGIVDRAKMPEKDVRALARMEAGSFDGERVLSLLASFGSPVLHAEKPVEIRDRQGRVIYKGRIDGAIKTSLLGVVPFEIKCYQPSLHGRIDSIDDFARSVWTRKAPRQLLAYLLAEGKPFGFFILYALGDMKLIPVWLEDHLEEAEATLKAGEEVLDAVESGSPPPFAKDPETCRSCWAFGVVCQPPIKEQAMSVLSDEEFGIKAERMLELEALAKEYDALKKEISDRVKEIDRARIDAGEEPLRAMAGNVILSVQRREVKGYELKARIVPARTDIIVKAQHIDKAKQKKIEEATA